MSRPVTLLAASLLAAAAIASSANATPPAVPSDAALELRLAAVYGNPLAGVVHIVEPLAGGGRSERWIDLGPGDRRQRAVQAQNQVVYEANGRLRSQHAQIEERAGTIRHDVVDYARRTWTTFFRTTAAPPRDRPLLAASASGLLGIAHTFAAMIRSGELQVLGRDRIDGRSTLHLRRTLNGARLDLWIDPRTYLLVSELASTSSGLSADERDYLRRNPANLARTRVSVPPGFRHRRAPAPTRR